MANDEEMSDLIKSTVESLNKDDEGIEFYRNGLLNVAQDLLENPKKREIFRKSNGFNLLTRNPGVSSVLAKTVESMNKGEMELLKAVYTMCCAAADGYKDNAIRALQIRGVVDNAFQMISTEKEVPKDVKLEGLRFMNIVTADPNICKLMCNKYDFSEVEDFVSDFGDTQHKIRANLFRLCRHNDDSEIQTACFKLLENLASCPRLHRRIVDCEQQSNLEKLAESIEESIEHGSEQPESFGAFGSALMRLCLHDRVRKLLASRDTFPKKCVIAVEALMDERTPESNVALSRLLRVISIICFDLPPEVTEATQKLSDFANKIEESNRPAQLRRWSRTLRTALDLRNERGDERFNSSLRMFYEHYDALVNESDEYTEPNLEINFLELLEKLKGAEWTDVPLILYAGAMQVLSRSINDEEKRKEFKAKNGFDLLTRHRVIPTAMRLDLEKMDEEIFLMMGVYKLGLAICQDNKENTVRYIQMPNVLDHAITLLTKPPDYRPEIMVPALEALEIITKNPDVCKLASNKHDLVPYLHHLFNMEIDWPDRVIELQRQVLSNLVQCPKLVWRLANEDNFSEFMDNLEKAIASGWQKPAIFCHLLDVAKRLAVNVRLSHRDFHRQSMVNAVTEALGIMMSCGMEVPDVEAGVNLLNFAEALLKRQKNEELFETVSALSKMDELPVRISKRASELLAQFNENQ